MYIKVGDIVQIRRDCTIEELMENKWNKAHKDTLEFLRLVKLDDTYQVSDVSNKGNAIIEAVGGIDNRLYVNHNLLEVVERVYGDDDCDEDDETMEMTIADIEEELGYKIKIVG